MSAAKLIDDTQRFSASGRAASVAQDLERAAAGVDVAWGHEAEKFEEAS